MNNTNYDTAILESLPVLKSRFPFRLGCTSYVFPDDILPNVRLMAPFVDDFEIVLFESHKTSNLPDKNVIRELSRIAEDNNLTYTVHLPVDRKVASKDNPVLEKGFAETVKRVIDLTSSFNPYAYILHLESVYRGSDSDMIQYWAERSERVCRDINLFMGGDSYRICVENLGYPPDWHTGWAVNNGFSLCLDIGHLWIYEGNWEHIIENLLNDVRVIHFHGTSNGRDHLSLDAGNHDYMNRALKKLTKDYSGVLTMEVFGRGDTLSSIRYMDDYINNNPL